MIQDSQTDFAALPRVLWMYWEQGEAQAPFLVRQCIDSWRRENPAWDLRVLDRTSWSRFPALEWLERRPDMSVQLRSDLLRLHLLTAIGGVWADATTFCNKPLEAWLPRHFEDSFFAFSSIRKDREVSSWFLAGSGESRLLSRWHEAMADFWRRHSFPPQGYWRRQLVRKLMSLRKRGLVSNDVWFSDFLVQRARAFPYPFVMYMFDRILDEDPALKALWLQRERLSDAACEHLQNPLGMNRPLSDMSRRFIDAEEAPLYKLNWRQDEGRALPGSNLEYLLQRKGVKLVNGT